jgi:hypothetical protein
VTRESVRVTSRNAVTIVQVQVTEWSESESSIKASESGCQCNGVSDAAPRASLSLHRDPTGRDWPGNRDAGPRPGPGAVTPWRHHRRPACNPSGGHESCDSESEFAAEPGESRPVGGRHRDRVRPGAGRCRRLTRWYALWEPLQGT